MDEAPETGIEIRCFCSRGPLLALAGRDARGEPFVHMKIWKQRRLYGEMVATSGVVRLRCRECYRWHTITIKHDVVVDEEPLPEAIPVS